LGLLTRDIIYLFFFESYSLVLFGAPSLTRGRVCHLSVHSQSTVVSQYLHNLHTIRVTHKSCRRVCIYIYSYVWKKEGGGYVELVFFSTIDKEWVLLLVVLWFHCRWWKSIFRSKSMSNCHRVCIYIYVWKGGVGG
jgi:hypothetical protein